MSDIRYEYNQCHESNIIVCLAGDVETLRRDELFVFEHLVVQVPEEDAAHAIAAVEIEDDARLLERRVRLLALRRHLLHQVRLRVRRAEEALLRLRSLLRRTLLLANEHYRAHPRVDCTHRLERHSRAHVTPISTANESRERSNFTISNYYCTIIFLQFKRNMN